MKSLQLAFIGEVYLWSAQRLWPQASKHVYMHELADMSVRMIFVH